MSVTDNFINALHKNVGKGGDVTLYAELSEGDMELRAGQDAGSVRRPASIRLCSNGDIYVNDVLAANEKEVVIGLKNFIEGRGVI